MNKHIESIVKLKNIDYSKITFENIDNEVFENATAVAITE